jgi:hypothetical protein
MSDFEDILWLDGTDQADLIRSSEISPGELIEAAIHRIEELNPSLNAVVTPMFDEARKTISGGSQGTTRGCAVFPERPSRRLWRGPVDVRIAVAERLRSGK